MCKTITFLPHDIPFPQVKIHDHLLQAADNIIHILTQPPETTIPSLQAGDPVRNALLEISDQFKRTQPLAKLGEQTLS